MIENTHKIERVDFGFSTGDGNAAVKTLEHILRAGRLDKSLNYPEHMPMFLLKLLRFGDIAVYKYRYERQQESPEILRRAVELNWTISKRIKSQILFDIAGIFSSYEHDVSKKLFNAPFFPDLKAYVRYGSLPPYKLIEFFEQDGCENVFLFHDNSKNAGIFYIFSLTVPREQFLSQLSELKERICEEMYYAMLEASKKLGSVIPPVPDLPDKK